MSSFTPVPLFITFAALAAFFGAAFTGYLGARKEIYRLWLENIVYGHEPGHPAEICAQTEELERSLHLSIDTLAGFLMATAANVMIYPAYGIYLIQNGHMAPDERITFLWTAVLMLIIYAGFYITTFLMFYRTGLRSTHHDEDIYRETGLERLYEVWKKNRCHDLKASRYKVRQEPSCFYRLMKEDGGEP